MTLRSGGGCLVVPFLSIWVLGWTAGTLFFDGAIAYATYQQVRTQWFATTPGTILHSAVDIDHDDEGTSYSVQVKYVYEVAGKEYQCERFRFQQVSGSRKWTEATVAALPREKTVTVYYDPTQPSHAILMPGVALCDLIPSIFLIPFNMVMVGVWAAIYYTLRGETAGDLPAGTQLLSAAHGQTVRLPGISPTFAAGCASGGAAFVLIFVLAFGFEMHGPLWPAFVAWGLILAAGIAAARWAIRDHASGQYDLLIDSRDRSVALPARRTEFDSPAWRSTSDLRSTDVFEQITTDSDGDEVKKYIAQFITADDRRLDVHTFTSENDARALASWLANRLRLRPPTART